MTDKDILEKKIRSEYDEGDKKIKKVNQEGFRGFIKKLDSKGRTTYKSSPKSRATLVIKRGQGRWL